MEKHKETHKVEKEEKESEKEYLLKKINVKAGKELERYIGKEVESFEALFMVNKNNKTEET